MNAGLLPPNLDPHVRNVMLIGYRGSGKTSVGTLLAQRLDWPFIDTDERIEAQAGRSIAEIFAEHGEPHFRSLEAGVIEEVTRGVRQVISVGGGAVLSADNRRALRAAGLCVWLVAPAEELHRRMQGDPRNASTRPALTERGGLDEVRRLLDERAPLYADLADHVVNTAGRPVAQVVEDIVLILTPAAP